MRNKVAGGIPADGGMMEQVDMRLLKSRALVREGSNPFPATNSRKLLRIFYLIVYFHVPRNLSSDWIS